MNVALADSLFCIVALLIFRRWRPEVAALAVFLGGWLLLPVGHYPPGSTDGAFAYWITGLAVPSDMLLTKAWIAPAAAVLGAAVFDSARVARLRPGPVDAPMLVWCAWPLLQTAFAAEAARPAGAVASLYLAGSWGLPWLLGRLYFASREGRLLLVRGLAWAAFACWPIALIEGVAGPMLYDLVYGPHPFRLDGAERYVGYRPLGFLENGNQYGLWISLGALAALWCAATGAMARRSGLAWSVAAVVTAMALAAQSAGAILLLATGACLLGLVRVLRPRVLIAGLLATLLGAGAVYLSGSLPIERVARDTAIGRQVVATFKAAGRGSFTWRIAQDQRLLKTATAQPLVGSAAWDWWRLQGSRPWGLAMLLLGQFGAVGLLLAFGTLLWPAARAAWSAPRASGWRPDGLPLLLATLLGLTVLDALLNSFVFFPALLIAGALCGSAEASGHGMMRAREARAPARQDRAETNR